MAVCRDTNKDNADDNLSKPEAMETRSLSRISVHISNYEYAYINVHTKTIFLRLEWLCVVRYKQGQSGGEMDEPVQAGSYGDEKLE